MGQPESYNIVIIMTDQQPYDLLACNGAVWSHTPNLDRLAASGCRFTGCYTTAPVCTPARAGIFTGMFSSSAGPSSNQIPLFPTTQTLGTVFSRAGYTTAYTGKWHLDGAAGAYYGTGVAAEGFLDEYWYDGRRFIADVGKEGFQRWQKGTDLQPEDCWAHRVADRGVRFLEKGHNEPFFLVVSFDEPHNPASAPERYYDLYRGSKRPYQANMGDQLEGKPAVQKIFDEFLKHRGHVEPGHLVANNPRYYGCNSFVDYEIGRVVDAVDRCSAENTVIIYTSDHGNLNGAHGLLTKGPTMYEETIHVPLIVRAPGMTQPGSVCNTLVSHIDLAPTACKLAGVAQPIISLPPEYSEISREVQGLESHPQFQGRDFVHLLPSPEGPGREAVFIEYNRFGISHSNRWGFTPIRCIRTDRYKLALYLLDEIDELYDLQEDPGEMTNRIHDPALASIRDALHDGLLAWMEKILDPLRGNGWWQRPWRRGKVMPANYNPELSSL